ncbi:MAG: hypothetical protein COB37_08425 [Kordiimonadales bacterium]|nr:MAG: hypothetical protein COB37_08425 [Kordiimonadales bacterium]
MFQNYLTSAVRNILRHKLFSFINVFGLAIGLAACIMILLFVRYETGFDSHISDADNIYRLESKFTPPGRSPVHTSQGTGHIKFGIEENFPELSNLSRFMFDDETALVRRGDTLFYETLMFADKNHFEFFDYAMVAGDKQNALSNPSSIVLNERMAVKYFGAENPIGQEITVTVLGVEKEFTVSAVARNLPDNSHMKMDMAIYLDDNQFAFNPNYSGRWMATNMYVYFKLAPNASAAAIEARFPKFIDVNATPEIREFGMTLASANLMAEWQLVKIKDIHLYGAPLRAMKPRGNLTNIISFSAIALVILAIAIINFTNLSTARISQRAREISVRKVLGAKRGQIMLQLLGEANILALTSVILALAFVEITLPAYNAFLDTNISLGFAENPWAALQYLGFAAVVGTLTGLYPALQLSSFRPSDVLKSNQSSSAGSSKVRNILVVLQFASSIALIIATATVYKQTDYGRTLDTGFKTDGMLIVKGLDAPVFAGRLESFKRELANHADVSSATLSLRTPSEEIFGATRANLPSSDDNVVLTMQPIDFDYFKTYEVSPIAGRLLDEARSSDRIRPLNADYRDGGAVLNETAVRRFGFASAEAAIGQPFRMLADTSDTSKVVTVTIVGVIPDLIIGSTRDVVDPSVYYVDEFRYRQLSLSFSTESLPTLMIHAENVWQKFAPDLPFRSEFLQDNIDALYNGEEATSQMFGVFAAFAILVSALGLYGLAAFVAERRTKEIGIRKVLGATMRDILALMVWQFSKPVLAANLIAWPIAWYVMSDWLASFQYRITLSPTLFLVAGLFALLIAWITIAQHASKVARTKPITALRYE